MVEALASKAISGSGIGRAMVELQLQSTISWHHGGTVEGPPKTLLINHSKMVLRGLRGEPRWQKMYTHKNLFLVSMNQTKISDCINYFPINSENSNCNLIPIDLIRIRSRFLCAIAISVHLGNKNKIKNKGKNK